MSTRVEDLAAAGGWVGWAVPVPVVGSYIDIGGVPYAYIYIYRLPAASAAKLQTITFHFSAEGSHGTYRNVQNRTGTWTI